jgi:hypothetical protein
MATGSDPAVTRVTIILDTPEDWFTWLFIRQDVANRYDLWKYINPDVAKENLPELTESPEPQLTDYKARATKLSACNETYCATFGALVWFVRRFP